ncbi:hypothetical protein F7734_28550 [Scytonema sp. UIC 10036]|uniref:ParB N-terminal domain-containing protein n=1 Tax=Scytonema sp. UIC 10036 TaxID=2304196 RepID=UPI0012DAC3B8|nr:ParB N-terminal domain-containing protein [Scytonema sp. UIC 10036]MUG96080.1 hypothetical protein [Scytonema sp. UIC 10036]
MEELEISLIHADSTTQSRVQLNQKLIDEYSEAITKGINFPPLTVFYDGTHYWLADGFHRLEATKKTAASTIAVDIRQGTQRDAILYSVSANAAHGLRRSNSDKRRAVLKLLSDPEWSQWSNNEVAKQCCVAEGLVRKLKSELSSYSTKIDRAYARKCGIDEDMLKKLQQTLLAQSSERIAQRSGTTYSISTTNIGGKNRRAISSSEYFEVSDDVKRLKSNDNALKNFSTIKTLKESEVTTNNQLKVDVDEPENFRSSVLLKSGKRTELKVEKMQDEPLKSEETELINQRLKPGLKVDAESKAKVNEILTNPLKENVRILNIKQEDHKQLEKTTQIFDITFSGVSIEIEGCPNTLVMLFQEMQNNPRFAEEILQQARLHRLGRV